MELVEFYVDPVGALGLGQRHEHARMGTFRPGDLIVLAAFGGGMAMTLAAYRWPPPGNGV